MTDSDTFRAAVAVCAATMLNSDASPYESALEILGLASGGVPADDGDEAPHALASIWGELTDWVELRPAETEQAEEHMLTAAREWLATAGDRRAEHRHFARWLHDVLGYERPTPPQP
ncbi:hypothetical protein ACFWMQ_11915 [Streptomyces sp. NPDC058372]|uniref:hypothetical protein n=1 Tax=unclassified Streptomyces TaxID=2593676 RepID=UPI0036610A29